MLKQIVHYVNGSHDDLFEGTDWMYVCTCPCLSIDSPSIKIPFNPCHRFSYSLVRIISRHQFSTLLDTCSFPSFDLFVFRYGKFSYFPCSTLLNQTFEFQRSSSLTLLLPLAHWVMPCTMYMYYTVTHSTTYK
jgi:hypothetical protein